MTEIRFDSPAAVDAALADPALAVPEAPPGSPPATLGWLRATVGRFANGGTHARRRALAEAELARIDPAALRSAAAESTLPADLVAPAVLAAALGADDPGLPGDVRTVAGHYLTGGGGAAADAAVARLVAAFGGEPGEATAARIGLLVQACAATGGLIAAAEGPDGLAAALAERPPVRETRRVAAAATRIGGAALHPGDVARLDLAAAGRPFGSGPRACPGKRHALAIAEGALRR